MIKIRHGYRFDNMKEYIQFFGLESLVKRISKLQPTYGQEFEKFVIKTVKEEGFRVLNTGAEYDVVKGADMKFLYEGSSVLVDLKLNKAKGFDKHNLGYIDADMFITKDSNEIFYFELAEGIEVGFALKNTRVGGGRGRKGYCVLGKPVITAIFDITGNAHANENGCNAHKYFTDKAAREFAKLVGIINLNLIREGYPAVDPQAFDFKYHKIQR